MKLFYFGITCTVKCGITADALTTKCEHEEDDIGRCAEPHIAAVGEY